MPELPEVESLRRILARSVVGRVIVSVRVREPRLRRPIAPDFARALRGRRIERLSRRAKYLLVELSGGAVMVAHLGMSGSLTHRGAGYFCRDFDPRHDHVELELDDSSRLVFNDPRRFGLLMVTARERLFSIAELDGLGPEPLSREFNAAYLIRAAKQKRLAIKNLIMDQRVVAGIGNIYASEILFRAGVRPSRRAGVLTRAELERIAAATAPILRAAIGSRGTTFRSYRDSRGEPGRFAARLRVYGRAGEPCYVCATAIKSLVIGQRASFFCPRCQH